MKETPEETASVTETWKKKMNCHGSIIKALKTEKGEEDAHMFILILLINTKNIIADAKDKSMPVAVLVLPGLRASRASRAAEGVKVMPEA